VEAVKATLVEVVANITTTRRTVSEEAASRF